MSDAIVRVVTVIPAYQAAATIGAVVSALRAALPAADVIVVDDGSTDGTSGVAATVADHVVRLTVNEGKGAALRAGFARALTLGADAVLTLDADGQHDPAFAPALVAALAGADVAIGSRGRRGTSMPLSRRATNALSARAMSACAGQPIADPQSGYRAFRREVLETVRATGDRYEYETDLLLRAARAGYRVAAVPIDTVYGSGARSHFRALRDGLLVVRSIWRHRSGALRRPAAGFPIRAPHRARAGVRPAAR